MWTKLKIIKGEVIRMESIIKRIDCFFDDKPVLLIVTKDGREYKCSKKEDVALLRGYFFREEILKVIKKIKKKKEFNEMLEYLEKQEKNMLSMRFKK